MNHIIAKGTIKNVEIILKGDSPEVYKIIDAATADAADCQFVVTDQFGGIYVTTNAELLVASEPFELRCNAQFDNEEVMKLFEKIYMDIKAKNNKK